MPDYSRYDGLWQEVTDVSDFEAVPQNGWRCPSCFKIWAPNVTGCMHCNSRTLTSDHVHIGHSPIHERYRQAWRDVFGTTFAGISNRADLDGTRISALNGTATYATSSSEPFIINPGGVSAATTYITEDDLAEVPF